MNELFRAKVKATLSSHKNERLCYSTKPKLQPLYHQHWPILCFPLCVTWKHQHKWRLWLHLLPAPLHRQSFCTKHRKKSLIQNEFEAFTFLPFTDWTLGSGTKTHVFSWGQTHGSQKKRRQPHLCPLNTWLPSLSVWKVLSRLKLCQAGTKERKRAKEKHL